MRPRPGRAGAHIRARAIRRSHAPPRVQAMSCNPCVLGLSFSWLQRDLPPVPGTYPVTTSEQCPSGGCRGDRIGIAPRFLPASNSSYRSCPRRSRVLSIPCRLVLVGDSDPVPLVLVRGRLRVDARDSRHQRHLVFEGLLLRGLRVDRRIADRELGSSRLRPDGESRLGRVDGRLLSGCTEQQRAAGNPERHRRHEHPGEQPLVRGVQPSDEITCVAVRRDRAGSLERAVWCRSTMRRARSPGCPCASRRPLAQGQRV